MFNINCLYAKPLIQSRDDFKGIPDDFREIYSLQFWFYLDNDLIEKIVAMRVYPSHDCIAFKIKLRDTKGFQSILLRKPELRILKRIWECYHPHFNTALGKYMTYSGSAYQQWVQRTSQNSGCFDWYMDLNLGMKND